MSPRKITHAAIRPGFSLVELLTVIAVLAIIGAILLAVMGNVRATVLKSQCVGNLRSLHAATMLWTMENDQRLPDGRYWAENKGTGSSMYPYQLAPYLDFAPMSQGAWSNWVNRDSPFKCNAAYSIRGSTSHWGRTYSINNHATSTMEGVARSSAWGYPRTIHEIHEPSLLALYMDGAAPSGSGNVSYWTNVQRSQVGSGSGASAPLQYPHNRTLNVVFLDGHIRNISEGEMIKQYSSQSYFWRYTGE